MSPTVADIFTALADLAPAGSARSWNVAHGNQPVAWPAPAAPTCKRPGALARELRRAGRTVRPDYPVGGWTVDLCVGDGERAIGLVCAVHPDGVQIHLARQRALLRAGWRLADAFASRWGGDPVRVAVDLATGTAAAD